MSRVVSIPRALNNDEWTRVVVDPRETFDAVGTVRVDGPLLSWTNGNLRVHVEPDADRYRVRIRTLKGNAGPIAAAGAFFTFLAALLLVTGLIGEMDPSNLVMAAVFALWGLGQLGYQRVALPRWAAERADQMERLAERIPRLLDRSGSDSVTSACLCHSSVRPPPHGVHELARGGAATTGLAMAARARWTG